MNGSDLEYFKSEVRIFLSDARKRQIPVSLECLMRWSCYDPIRTSHDRLRRSIAVLLRQHMHGFQKDAVKYNLPRFLQVTAL